MLLRLVAFLFILSAMPLLADEGLVPVISIESPDTGQTFAFGTLKNRALIWNESTQTLSVEATFVDEEQSVAQTDSQRFRLPGVSFDKEHQVYYAVSSTGERVPIARRKKAFLFPTIEVLPNAIIRIFHPHGVVKVRLEAIRPEDLARAKAEQGDTETNSMGQHTISLENLLH